LRWEATNWNGACDELARIAKPTLVITGTDDNDYVPYQNSLVIAGKVPGAWLVQIENAGHAVMDQYPDEIVRYYKHFYRRRLLPLQQQQPNLGKKVYQQPDYSIFENADHAAADHAGLGGGQELSWYSGD